ncbi:NAD(P)-dependent oxidoreductase [Rathayibacter soli]|uniref:NAD(P)-dependent oxidoreductase n=1 Tax=Rathayibacter soli TaxID=3144168 RepID=UPI0027E4A6A6|nr:NAD(P)-dependent oxidoreductase [Glaciibacter superstes]
MHVVIIDPFVPLEQIQQRVRLEHRIDALSREIDLTNVQVVITAGIGVSASDLTRMPSLCEVITASTGIDHLDKALLMSRQVQITNVPDYCTEEVSDHAVAQTCALLRSLPRAISNPDGAWDNPQGVGVRRFSSARIGVLGTGRIGRAICRKLLALGMLVSAAQRPSSDREMTPIPGVTATSLDDMLPKVDVLVIAAPGAHDGGVVLDQNRLASLRQDALLVNVSRASLVDLVALQRQLEAGLLAGAFFDAWEPEPPVSPSSLMEVPGLFLSPHSGWYSPESASDLWGAVAARLDELEETRPSDLAGDNDRKAHAN